MLSGLSPGDELPRREIHDRHGGRRQTAISPSSETNAVLFFMANDGAYGGWDDDGFLHLQGEGRRGDQRLTQGNKAIANHRNDGRSLEGFVQGRMTSRYLGEFELVEHYFTDAPDPDYPDSMRQIVVFKLRPLNEVTPKLPRLPISPTTLPRLDAAEQVLEPAFFSPSQHRRHELRKTEVDLVYRYTQHLRQAGHEVTRNQIIPAGETRRMVTDIWDKTTGMLIEAKNSVTRDHIRMAVGQLLDYKRFIDAESLAVLVPTQPRPDLIAFLKSAGIDVIYPEEQEWIHIPAEGEQRRV